MHGELRSSLREKKLSSYRQEKNLSAIKLVLLKFQVKMRHYQCRQSMITRKMENLEQQEIDGSLKDQENTFLESKFKLLREERLFLWMPMRVSMSEITEQEKSKKSKVEHIFWKHMKVYGRNNYHNKLNCLFKELHQDNHTFHPKQTLKEIWCMIKMTAI